MSENVTKNQFPGRSESNTDVDGNHKSILIDTSQGKKAPLQWLFGLNIRPELSHLLPREDSVTQPLHPSKDPWYHAPIDFKSKQPGDILRIRTVPGHLHVVVENISTAYNILYRSTDSRDRASWGVTTLLIPPSLYVSPGGKVALLSYQIAYNSANVDSSPSIGLYELFVQENRNLGLKSINSFLNDLLSKGWIISIPDYGGPDAAFGASVQAGNSTLDSIRAVHNLANLTGSALFNTAIWGYSGGSIATLAAAELQPQYAPELVIHGAILGGLADDVFSCFDKLNKSVLAGNLASVLLGITAQYRKAREYLESRLVHETRDDFMSVRHLMVTDVLVKFSGKDIYAYFIGGVDDLHAPILQDIYEKQAKLGYKGVPTMPMFVYKAIGDEFCPVEQTDATMTRLCRAGADISYERNTVGNHVTEIENGKPRAIQWLWKIFDESYERPASGCSMRDVTIDVLVAVSNCSCSSSSSEEKGSK